MELLTTTALGMILWDTLGKPIVEKVQKEYYSKWVISKVGEALSKLPFKKEEKDIIEAEILNCDQEIIEDKDKFLEYIKQNPKIQNIFKQSTYTFNDKVYGNIIDKVESGANVTTNYHFDVHNYPK